MIDRPRIRCAVYTRKSTDEGLEQEFNSLDAQREAAEAYIASQKSEGWVCLPTRYDDGGYSGGTLERPAFNRLLADIDAGKIDCVVVYKVDRFSRSLLDFARVMSRLEDRGVKFVSVTQQFNTTSSMGRLTLNILLSFAQFEREIISERTRDKIAAARRKGKWSGGRPILGYDTVPQGGRVAVNEEEAAQVREIFEMYLHYKSLIPTVRELNRRGWRTKAWTSRKGKPLGGKTYSKDHLYRMLTNVAYLGKVRYKDEVHEGEHPAIVSDELFQRVQDALRHNGRTGGTMVRNKYGALLKGLLHCAACGCGMMHTYTTRGKRRYRYYVCMEANKKGWDTCPTKSLPAGEIEQFVVDRIRAVGNDPSVLAETLSETRRQATKGLAKLEAERKTLQRQLQRHNAEVRKLLDEAGLDGKSDTPTSARLADLQERICQAEQRATEVREQIVAMSGRVVEERELATAMTMFDPVWDSLSTAERARVVQLLVEQVTYDGRDGMLSITFRPNGIKALVEEAQAADAQMEA